jgi:hypothetical protein
MVVFVAIVVFLQWRASRTNVAVVSDPLRLAGAIFVGVALILLGANDVYGTYNAIFREWDPVVSWNRWAIDLFGNEYHHYGIAYPVLFPGIWSLVYKAQGDTSVWFIGKLTLFSVPIILGLSVILLVERRRLLSAAIVGIFVAYFFFVYHSVPMLSGNMDIPVAALMLVAGVCTFLATANFSDGRVAEALSDASLAAVFVGLSTVTKQAGVLLLAPFLFMLVFVVVNGQVRFRAALGLIVIALVPLACYLAIYIPLDGNLFGGLPDLENLARKRAMGEGRLRKTYQQLWTMIPPAALFVAIAVGLFNVINIKRITGAIGVVFLATSFVGTLLYSYCCSYDPRNGWWIISLLVLSAVFGQSPVEAYLLRKSAAISAVSMPAIAVPAIMLTVAVASAAVIGFRIPDGRARQIQEDRQWEIISPEINSLIRSKLDVLGKDGMLVSFYPAGWLPGMRARFWQCFPKDTDCVRAVAGKSRKILILVDQDGTDYPDLRPLMTQDKLLGTAQGHGGTQLYGPFNANELGPSTRVAN